MQGASTCLHHSNQVLARRLGRVREGQYLAKQWPSLHSLNTEESAFLQHHAGIVRNSHFDHAAVTEPTENRPERSF